MTEFTVNEHALRLQLINGIRADVWRIYEPQIAKFVAKHKLKPAGRRTPRIAKGTAAESVLEIGYIKDMVGGRRIAHLHYKGELYFVKSSQWKEFSGGVMRDMSKRLVDAKQVNFTEFMGVTKAVGRIVR